MKRIGYNLKHIFLYRGDSLPLRSATEAAKTGDLFFEVRSWRQPVFCSTDLDKAIAFAKQIPVSPLLYVTVQPIHRGWGVETDSVFTRFRRQFDNPGKAGEIVEAFAEGFLA
jgi:hypothetical protein